MGQTVAAFMGVKGKVTDRLKPTFRFTLWSLYDRIMEFGHMNTTQHRYRLGVFPVPHGSVDSKVFPSSDPLMPATLGHGKVAPCQILCWFVFYVAEEGNDTGFDVRGQDVHLSSQSLVGHEDLGELLPASASLDHRIELVLDPLLMMLEKYGKSLMSTTFPIVKLDRLVESASQWICLNL